jgi:hypothetical protein
MVGGDLVLKLGIARKGDDFGVTELLLSVDRFELRCIQVLLGGLVDAIERELDGNDPVAS